MVVKVLEVVADDATQAAFERECRAIGKLSGHAHILTVHESGLPASGKPYPVMALAAESLEDRLREWGPLGWRDAGGIGEKIAGALEFARQAGTAPATSNRPTSSYRPGASRSWLTSASLACRTPRVTPEEGSH